MGFQVSLNPFELAEHVLAMDGTKIEQLICEGQARSFHSKMLLL